jgi:hypothetical protein
MKRNLILVLVMLVGIANYGQKNKSTKAVAKPTATLAKADNLVAEIKTGNFQLTISENGKPKDAIVVKAADPKFTPTDCKLTAFKASGATLYLLNWTEKTLTKTELKTENITTIYSKVYDVTTKTEVFSNYQTTNNIVEKVFLDKLKNASETQEKIRREGFEFILNPDGSIVQKSKTQENKWIFDAKTVKYVDSKKKK